MTFLDWFLFAVIIIGAIAAVNEIVNPVDPDTQRDLDRLRRERRQWRRGF